MTDVDKSILSIQNDDTDYEAWLGEHDLDTKEVGDECMVRQNHCGGYVAGDHLAELARPTLTYETPSVSDQTSDDAFNEPVHSFNWVKLLIIIVPILFLVGYYSYNEVRASLTRVYSGAASLPSLGTTTIGLTITPENLKVGLVGHFTFDGMDMDWASSTAEVVEVSPPYNCGVDTVLDADLNIYNTIEIGSQCWMQQNMRVGTRINGGTNPTNNGTIEKWCYENDDLYCNTINNPNHPDGGLYEWNEVMQYSTTPGARGICPTGWHIPTHDEFTTLERAICTSGSCAADFPYDTTTTGLRGTTEGTKLKSGGSSGLEFNLTGNNFFGSYINRFDYSFLWSSSLSGITVWYRRVGIIEDGMERNKGGKMYGLSVRCMQDPVVPIMGNAVGISQTSVTPGKSGQALNFNGSNAYISAGDNDELDTTTALSVCAWVKHDSLSGDDAIVSKEDSSAGLLLFRDDVGDVSGRTDIYSFVVKDSADGDTAQIESPSNTSQQNKWTQVCGTYQANNADGLRLYLDGVGVADNPISTIGISAINAGTFQLLLGVAYSGNYYYHGQIDDVRIYNRALSATEVSQLSGIWLGGTI